MERAPVLYLDVETTCLRRSPYPGGRRIWEIGGTRVDLDGTEHDLQVFIRIEDLGLAEMLPDPAAACRPDGTLDTDPSATWFHDLPKRVCESLDIGGFHQRHPQRTGRGTARPARQVAEELLAGPWLRPETVAGKTVQVQFIGAVQYFDHESLHHLLAIQTGLIGLDFDPWHYHTIDAETIAGTALGWTGHYDSGALTAALGVDTSDLVPHSAFDDAVWARRLVTAARNLPRRPS
jgi:hypothetical protein